MNLFKQKLTKLAPIIVLAVVIIFSLTLASNVNPTPKNLPIAIVNLDKGMDTPQGHLNMGDMIIEKINEVVKSSTESEPAVEFIKVANEAEVKTGLNDKEYYAAMILPKDFSQKQISLQTPNPSSSEITLLINQGKNANGAMMANQMLTQMVDTINAQTRTKILEALDKSGMTVTAKQVAVIANPITKKIENVNAIGTHTANGNAPVVLITPLWMASLIGSVLTFLAKNKTVVTNRSEKLKVIFEQLILCIVLAFVAGFGIATMAEWIGFTIPNYVDVAIFLTLAYICFYLLISAVMSWIGFGGVGIFALIFFFGGSLIGMAPELLPTVSRDWLYSWIPMRFGAEGLREIFYFGEKVSMSHSMIVLLSIGVISLVVLFASIFKPTKSQSSTQTLNT